MKSNRFYKNCKRSHTFERQCTSCLNTYPFLRTISLRNIQCPVRKKIVPVEQTMEKQIRETVLFVLLTISVLKNYTSCMEISSQIVFDSRENEGNSNDLRDFLNLNKVHDQVATAQQILKSFNFKINSENELRMLNTKRSDFIEVSKLFFTFVIVCNVLSKEIMFR